MLLSLGGNGKYDKPDGRLIVGGGIQKHLLFFFSSKPYKLQYSVLSFKF